MREQHYLLVLIMFYVCKAYQGNVILCNGVYIEVNLGIQVEWFGLERKIERERNKCHYSVE